VNRIFLLLVLIFIRINSYGQEFENPNIPPSKIFYNFGKNLLYSITYNYGLNFALSGLETYGMIRGGLDWKYYQLVYGNRALANYGMAANITGYSVPVVLPIIVYVFGRQKEDTKLQVLGAALGQTTIIATGMNMVLKGITNRRQAGIYDLDPQTTDYSDDFSFDFFTRGVIDGWPSGHTMNAVAAAATISEIYKDTTWVKIVAYSYATILSLGMTVCDHWVSDIIAGWLLGYAIGKTVGRSFNRLLGNSTKENTIELVVSPKLIGVKLVL
jgi:membrane-associated phospholipid phosphatase